jgi:predicted phosphodiesterase
MRLAVLSDVHGNLLALEAVLADIETQGEPDAYLVLGDLAAFCPWPSETLARLRELPEASFLQGNTDRYLATGRRPQILPAQSPDDWARMPAKLAERDANFRWTVERISHADYQFLRDLPTRLELDVPGYGHVIAVHANAVDDETFLRPEASAAEIREYFAGLDARLVLYGHTHCTMDRTIEIDGMRRRVVNDGSAGIPLDGDPCPAYALLDFGNDECHVRLHRVAYGREAVIAELERVDHPAKGWIGGMLRKAKG